MLKIANFRHHGNKGLFELLSFLHLFPVYGAKKPLNGLSPFFFLVKDIHDVITHAKFGDDRLRGSGVVAGQISAFPIDFAGRPYNTTVRACDISVLDL